MIEALIIIFGGYLVFGDDEPEVSQSQEPVAQVQEVEVETRRAVVTVNDGISQTKHESIIVLDDDFEVDQAAEEATPVIVKPITRNKDGYIIADLSGD